jgi:hypothetical protein
LRPARWFTGNQGASGDPRNSAQAIRKPVDVAELDVVPTTFRETSAAVSALAIKHQSQFPWPTVSFNLEGNASLGGNTNRRDD